jgi:Fe2+ transport system protein FeoA
VERVEDDDADLLRYLYSVGLVPQAELTVLERSCFDDNLSLQVGAHVVVLGPRVTRQIYVEVL